MKDFIFDFFNYAVFFYSSLLILSFILFSILSLRALRKRWNTYLRGYVREVIRKSPYTPGISIIAPAYNEETTIIDNVNSMLALDYPLFEVVIVNDGSTDSTLQKMIEYYRLVEVPYAYMERIKTKPYRRMFRSTLPRYKQLTLVDKENGGTKADASNAGINTAQYPYFICTDVDCILNTNALYDCIWPIISSDNRKQVIAVSGTMLMGNGCIVNKGQMEQVRMPRTPIPLFQQLEYMRSFLIGKMGWSALNGIPNVSGGFGLFDRSVAIAAGGYDGTSFAEDMDLITRMVGYMCDFNLPYRIVQVPDTCCWTEGPPGLRMLQRQRTRWARGLIQTLAIHHKMIFNKKYRQTGLLTLPYIVVFEFLAPIIECSGFLTFLYLAFTNGINWHTAWLILLSVYGFCQLLTLIIIVFDYYVGMRYSTVREYGLLMLASLLEPFIYHPFLTFFSLKGYTNYLVAHDFKWKKMERAGFKHNIKKS
ncbi:MAG: glycosyltransferase [Prevotellaceae bacterium]|jgi:cellulose synthase/poly-beta-1,6-N-acetylglucosamine synthase-like glycosyltransferase|nr:glycosyltransferase [Prevotellaceae bacterium]